MLVNIKKAVDRAIKNIRIATRGAITSVKKSNDTIFALVSDEEELRDIKIVSPYGLYSLPVNGSMGQIIFNNSAKKAALVGIEHDDTRPIKIDVGEIILYNTNTGTYIHLSNDGNIYHKGKLIEVQ